MRFSVVSSGSPELGHLASRLASNRELGTFVAPFVHAPGAVDRLLPGRARRLLSKRSAPCGVHRQQVESAALGEEIVRVGTRGRWPRLETRLLQYRNARLSAAASVLAAKGESVVVSHGCALEAAQRERTAKVVLNMQSCHPLTRLTALERELLEFPNLAAPPTRGYAPQTLARFDEEFRRVDGILVGSKFAARSLVDHGVASERIHVVPYGVDSGHFVPNWKAHEGQPFTVLFVGTLTPGKGVHYLIRAFQEWGMSNAVLRLVGAAPHGVEWLRISNPNVEWAGFLRGQELTSAMQRASVMVFPTLFEGMPLTVLEAMACGVPVVATDRGADEVIEDGVNGIIVPSADTSAIKVALESLHDMPETRLEMSHGARRTAERFSWGQYQSGVVNVLNAI